MVHRSDIVNEATRHVGYHEGAGNANVFSHYLGLPNEAWCGDFVTAVYKMSALPLPSMQHGLVTGFAYVPDAFAFAGAHNAKTNSWQASPGDIVCFDWTKTGRCDTSQTHTGIVQRWENGTLHTIEGNTGSPEGVYAKSWSAPSGTGNVLIAGVIDAGKLVTFGTPSGPPPPLPQGGVPPFVRGLMLKSPHMHGDDVLMWQRQMIARGWHLPATGEYDQQSRDACRAFQMQKGLHPATGTVGPRTWAAAWTEPITPE